MSETIDITEYLAFIDTLKKVRSIEKRLEAAKKWMEEQNADTIFFPDDYLEENKRVLIFDSMVFAGHLKFESSLSLGSFKLQNCRITRDMSFDALRNVERTLEISDSKIGGSIELKKDSTIGTLRIRNCVAEKISMQGVTVRETTFLCGTIAASLDATGAKFVGPVFCLDAHFKGNANFNNAEFSTNAEFSNSTFHLLSKFTGAKFSGAALFSNTKFCHETVFNFAKFSSFVNFQRATFVDAANFFRVIFDHPVVFSQAVFEKETRWTATEFKKNATFDKAIFCYPPNFRSATFHVVPDLHALEITKPYEPSDNTVVDIQIAPTYRRLKKLAVEANNHRGFLDHGAREVRAKCLGGAKGNALIPSLYFALSNHGRSILLPFIWLLAVILFGGIFYAATDARENVILLVASFIPVLGFPFCAVYMYCNPKRSDEALEFASIYWAGASIVVFLILRILFEFEIRVTALYYFGSLVAVLFLRGVFFRYLFPVLTQRHISLWRAVVWLLALASSVGLGFALVYAVQVAQATEGSRALATSVLASLSITQLFRLFPGGIHEVSCSPKSGPCLW